MLHARPLIDAMPREFTLTLVDVGSAGGLNPRWNPFGELLSSVLFDPRELRAKGQLGRGCTRIYPVALGSRTGEATLHQTRLANMSSFLEPDQDRLALFGRKRLDAEITGTEQVYVSTLDELAARDGFKPDVLKIDTQGSEMLVLEGASASLESVTLAEVEISLFQRYKGQPLLADIERLMAASGFELLDLIKLRRYRFSNSLGIRNSAVRGDDRSGRLAYADALFVRSEDQLLGLGAQGLLSAVVALAAYGKADMAARLLDLGKLHLASGQADAIGRALRRLRAGLLHKLLGRAA